MKIAYETMDGRVHVLAPVLKNSSLDEWIAEHGHVIPADAQNVTLVAEMPEERGGREMWAIEDGKIVARGRPAMQPAPALLEHQLRASIEALEAPPAPSRWSLKDLMRRADQPDAEASPSLEQHAPPEALALPPTPPPELPEQDAHTDLALPSSEPVEASIEPAAMQPAPEPQHHAALPLPPPPVLEHHRVSDVVVTDAERKRQAVERVSFAAMRVGDAQIRYEIAVQADNGNTDAMEMLQAEASIYRMPVSALAKQIIAQRAIQEQRVMRAYAAKAQAMMIIENAQGAEIDDVAEAYVQKIMEESDAGST